MSYASRDLWANSVLQLQLITDKALTLVVQISFNKSH